MLKTPLQVAALCTALALPGTLMAQEEASLSQGDLVAGEKLYKKSCRQCHGPTAKGMASYPTLRGFSVEYLVETLIAFRKGERRGPNTPLMAPNARKLTDEQILDVSAFIVSLDHR